MADWTCTNCGWVNRMVSTKCLSCGAAPDTIGYGEPTHPPEPEDPRMLPSEVAGGAVSMEQDAWIPSAPPDWFSTSGLGRGVVFAALAAVVGTIAWYAIVALSNYQIAFVAIGVGWLVGNAALFGAGQRGSVWLSVASVALTLLALAVSEYLIIYHWTTQFVGEPIELLQPLDVIVSIVIESVTADPGTLIFWLFALVAAGYYPLRAVKPRSDPTISPAI